MQSESDSSDSEEDSSDSQEDSTDSEEDNTFCQKLPPLTKAISDILKRYPDGQIFKVAISPFPTIPPFTSEKRDTAGNL